MASLEEALMALNEKKKSIAETYNIEEKMKLVTEGGSLAHHLTNEDADQIRRLLLVGLDIDDEDFESTSLGVGSVWVSELYDALQARTRAYVEENPDYDIDTFFENSFTEVLMPFLGRIAGAMFASTFADGVLSGLLLEDIRKTERLKEETSGS